MPPARRMNEELLSGVLEKLKVEGGPDHRGEYTAWCVFHPDGQGEPPHRPNLSVSERGYYCHACGENGGLRDLAQHLGVSVGRRNSEPEATYDYRDERGELLFQVVRLPGKRFRQRRRGEGGGWVWNVKGVRRVLYRLPELLANPDKTVYLVEGEKDADRLRASGLLATTVPGGANKWRDDYSAVLQEREVVIVPDNDQPGQKHAVQIARGLRGVSSSLKVVQLPGLPEKGDVSDWLDMGHSAEELSQIAASAPQWTPEEVEPADAPGCDRPQTVSQSTFLVDLAMRAGAELFSDQRGEAYAAIPEGESRRIVRMDGRSFSRWLYRLLWEDRRAAPGREAISAAVNNLCAQALFEGEEYELHTRHAWHEGALWIDLDGKCAVRVGESGWRVCGRPPILFRHYPHQQPLPEPTEGGQVARLLEFVNVDDGERGLLLLCYVATALLPDIAVPVLVVHGPKGSAKTSLLKAVKDLVDPTMPMVRSAVRSQEEFALAAFQNRMLCFDNLTSLRGSLSDAICAAVTGEGFSKRKLYSDEDSTVFEYRTVVGLGGINLVATQPDLLDRSLILELDAISPQERCEERVMKKRFQDALPGIFGGLLDVVSEAMRRAPGLSFSRMPRMADFTRWAAAAAEALGRNDRDFLEAYGGNIEMQNESALSASPVGQAVVALMERESRWEGTPADLLGELVRVAKAERIDTSSQQWPGSANWLWRRLNEVRPNLASIGIVAEHGRDGTARKIELHRDGQDAVIAVTAVSSPHAEQEGSADHDNSAPGAVTEHTPHEAVERLPDGNDANDDILARQLGPVFSAGEEPFPWCDAYHERLAVLVEDGGKPEDEARARAAEYARRCFAQVC